MVGHPFRVIVKVPGPLTDDSIFTLLRRLTDAVEGGQAGEFHSCGGARSLGSKYASSYGYWFELAEVAIALERIREVLRRPEAPAGVTVWEASADWQAIRQLDLATMGTQGKELDSQRKGIETKE